MDIQYVENSTLVSLSYLEELVQNILGLANEICLYALVCMDGYT